MNRDEMLGPAVSESGQVYEPGTGYKGIAFGGVILVAIAIKAGHMVWNTAGPGDAAPDLTAQIAASVAQARGQLPARVDELTTFEDISAEGTKITYRVRIDADIPAGDIPATVREQEALIRQHECRNPEFRRLLAAGASFAWRYTDSNGDRFTAEVRSCGTS